MTNVQKHTIRASEIRQRLNEIAGLEGDALTDEVRQEETSLQTEYRDVETKLRAAVAAEPDSVVRTETTESTEDRELRELHERSTISGFIAPLINGSAPAGSEAELQQHFGLPVNHMPLGMIEERAVTTAPSDVETAQSPILQPVFAQGVAGFLGVDMPVVGAGEAVYPVLTTVPAVRGPFAASEEAAETDGAFESENLSPTRLQASFFWRRVDAARFPGMEEALRQAINSGLSEKVDQQIVAGPNGLLTGNNLAANAAGALSTYGNYRAEFGAGRVDGRWAGSVADIRSVVGAATYGHMDATFLNNSEESALDTLIRKTGGVRVSAHVAAVANKKQQSVIRLGMRPDMVAPMWQGVELVPDPVTKSQTGEVMVTGYLMHAVKIRRAGGFRKQEVQVVA